MRWIVFFIFAYVMLGAQVGVGDHLRVYGASPNLVLMAVLFVCLNTARESALSAALVLGLLQDLLTLQPPGLNAFAYGVVGLLTARASRGVYANHPLTHVFFAFVGQAVVAGVVMLHGLVRPPHPEGGAQIQWAVVLGSCLYTAAVAPLVLGLLERGKGAFGFTGVRRRVRAYE